MLTLSHWQNSEFCVIYAVQPFCLPQCPSSANVCKFGMDKNMTVFCRHQMAVNGFPSLRGGQIKMSSLKEKMHKKGLFHSIKSVISSKSFYQLQGEVEVR